MPKKYIITQTQTLIERLAAVEELYTFYEVDLQWVRGNIDVDNCGEYLTGTIYLNWDVMSTNDDFFWSTVYHELAHYVSDETFLYKKAYHGSLRSMAKYQKKYRYRVERFTDKLAKRMMANDYPPLKYIPGYTNKKYMKEVSDENSN